MMFSQNTTPPSVDLPYANPDLLEKFSQSEGQFFGLQTAEIPIEVRSPHATTTPTAPKKKQGTYELIQTPEFRQWPACIDPQTAQVVVPSSTSPSTWTLQVSASSQKQGHPHHTAAQTVADLHQLPMAQQLRRVVSRHGWSYKARWVGVPFKTWIEHLPQPLKDAVKVSKWVEQKTASGVSLWLNLKPLMEGEPLLMYGESDQSLTPWHGGPLRLGVFHRYIEMGLPQLTHLHFTDVLPEALQAHGPSPEQELAQWGFVIGKYYAYDLKNFKPVERPREVTAY
ncbi:MAG: molybdopterin-dependent oxidoreductase [Vampirovibrionales bacterium]